MKTPVPLPRHAARTAIALACALSFASAFAEPALSADVPAATQAGPVETGEQREALMMRALKILNYGPAVGNYRTAGKLDATIALGLLGDPRVVPTLREHLQNEENNQLRIQIARTLGWIGGQEAIAALEVALQDRYTYVRKQAAESLKILSGRDYQYDQTGLAASPTRTGQLGAVAEASRLHTDVQQLVDRRELRAAAQKGLVPNTYVAFSEPFVFQMDGFPVGILAEEVLPAVTRKEVLVSRRVSKVLIKCSVYEGSREKTRAALQKSLEQAGVRMVDVDDRHMLLVEVLGKEDPTETAKP